MIDHVCIQVSDLGAGIEFYKKWFDFRLVKIIQNPGIEAEMILGKIGHNLKYAKLSSNGYVLELHQYDENISNQSQAHIGIIVKDIDDLYKRMQDDSVKFVNKPVVYNGRKICICSDPWNNKLELMEYNDPNKAINNIQ